MPVFCELCGKEFLYPNRLRRHLAGKLPCVKKKYNCHKCNKEFKIKSQLTRHLNGKTDCAKRVVKYPKNNKIEYMKNIIFSDNSTNITNVTNININIGADKVIPFGKINYDYIMNNNVFNKNMMYDLIKFAAMPVMYFRYVHLNPDHPERHNVLLKNKKDETMNIKESDGWKVKHFNEVIREYFSNLQNLLNIFKKKYFSDETFTEYLKNKFDDIDYKFTVFFEDDKTTSNTKQWMRSIKKELTDANVMLRKTKRKDNRKIMGEKEEALNLEEEKKIEEYKELYEKKIHDIKYFDLIQDTKKNSTTLYPKFDPINFPEVADPIKDKSDGLDDSDNESTGYSKIDAEYFPEAYENQ